MSEKQGLSERVAKAEQERAKAAGGDAGTVARVNSEVPTLKLDPRSGADVKTAEAIEKARRLSGS